MSLREWLIIIGALLILGVIVDGLRRMHRARQESLEIARGMGSGDIGQTPIDDDYNSELPNGGARVVGDMEEPASAVSKREPAAVGEAPRSSTASEPFGAADSGEPMMEEPPREPASEPAAATESITASDDDGILGPARVSATQKSAADTADSGMPGSGEGGGRLASAGANAGQLWQKLREGAARVGEAATPSERASSEASSQDTLTPEQATGPTPGSAPDTDERPLAGANRPDAEEVVVVNVHCRDEDRYQGKALQKLLEACGMEFGDLGIYHRHEEPDTRSPVQFSVASAVAPGTLRPEEIDALETPGVSFFMSLPGPREPIQAFDYMLETAQTLARNLGGEVRDENHSVMTTQTIEHCRQRIREFERKRRSVKA